MSDIVTTAPHSPTMQRLEAIRKTTDGGVEYWRARDLHPILGYDTWGKFEPVIARASDALAHNGEDPSHHIARTGKLITAGKGAQRNTLDYFLTRAACYLIAMNGDGSKREIASAQGYFAVQTRRSELVQQSAADLKRLKDRERVAAAVKSVNAAAKDVGVQRYGIFTDAGWKGFYGMSVSDVELLKGVPEGEHIFDHAGPLELAGNAFRMELAEKRLSQGGVSGERQAIDINRAVGESVRETMKQQIGHGPEEEALASEPIKAVKARLLGKVAPKMISDKT